MYMEALQGEGKEYGKREVLYPDFERTASGLQYKDMVVGAADAKTFDPTEGRRGDRLGWIHDRVLRTTVRGEE